MGKPILHNYTGSTTIDKSELKWNLLPSYKANDVFTIGYAGFPGHKMEKERIDWLVRAVCDLNEDGKPCRLLIAGCDRKIVEDFDPTIVNYSSYTHSVQYLGYLGHQDCLRMLASCDFSAIVREDKRVTKAGFPTKLSESLGCGTPVISTPFSNILLLITLFDRILLTIGGRQRQSIAPA